MEEPEAPCACQEVASLLRGLAVWSVELPVKQGPIGPQETPLGVDKQTLEA